MISSSLDTCKVVEATSTQTHQGSRLTIHPQNLIPSVEGSELAPGWALTGPGSRGLSGIRKLLWG